MADHLSTVGSIYEAFGRGDVAWILDRLDDDVAWDVGIRTTDLPYLQPGIGKAHVAGFFASLAGTFAIDHFVIGTIAEAGDVVLATVDAGGQIVDGGRIPVNTEVHEFRFGPDGKVTSFRHIGDWAVHERAMAVRAHA
jgi:ketosteroid isomerase-like protein